MKIKNAIFTIVFGHLYIFILPFFVINIQASDMMSHKHPRLILTENRLLKLQEEIKTTHNNIWKLTVQLVDQFAEQEIPEFNYAHNRYRRIGDTMPVLGLVYRLTGDKKYLNAATKWIEALLDVPDWRGSQNLGRSSWVIGCALLYDWLFDELGEDLKNRIKKRLMTEALNIMEHSSSHRALSNHLLIETSALGMTGLVIDERSKRKKFLEQANAWARYIIDHAPLDGSWGEGIQYWQYGTGYFLRFLEAASSSGYKDYYKEYNWLRENGYFPIYFSLPGKLTNVLNFSDCGSKRYIPPFLLYCPASKYKNPYFQDYGRKIQLEEAHKFIWLDLIFYDSLMPTQNIFSLPTLKHFSDHDFVSMRSGWEEDATIVGFRCGPAPGHRNQNDPTREKNRGFGPGHQHPDINSFCIFSKGEWLAIDPGYTKLKETRNHNTIIVNGHGQAGAGEKWLDFMAFEARTPAPAILRVESNDVYDYVLGDAGNIYVDEARLKHFRRHLLFLKPDIVIIADDLTAKDKSRFEWLLNAFEKIKHISTDQFEITRNSVRLVVNNILPKATQAEISERKIKASDVKGEADVDSGMMKTLNLSVSGVNNTKMLMVLSILKDKNSIIPDISFVNNRLIIKHEDRSWQVLYLDEVEDMRDPVLVVENPGIRHEYYHFIRSED
jgi:hypothetical protein